MGLVDGLGELVARNHRGGIEQRARHLGHRDPIANTELVAGKVAAAVHAKARASTSFTPGDGDVDVPRLGWAGQELLEVRRAAVTQHGISPESEDGPELEQLLASHESELGLRDPCYRLIDRALPHFSFHRNGKLGGMFMPP